MFFSVTKPNFKPNFLQTLIIGRHLGMQFPQWVKNHYVRALGGKQS